MFRQMDLKGKTKDDTKLNTVHQNTISKIRVFSGSPGRVSKFSSKYISVGLRVVANKSTATGVDGRLVLWTM